MKTTKTSTSTKTTKTKPQLEQYQDMLKVCDDGVANCRKTIATLKRSKGNYSSDIKYWQGCIKSWKEHKQYVMRLIKENGKEGNMDVFKIDDVNVELHSWIAKNAKGKKQDDIKKAFAQRLAKVARFIDCNRVEYIDGKTEEYVFHRISGGMLRMATGCTVLPPTSWIKFGVEPPEKAKPDDQILQPAEERPKVHACNAVPQKDNGEIHACNAVVKVGKKKKKK